MKFLSFHNILTIVVLIVSFTTQSSSQTYQWKELPGTTPKKNVSWIFFHVDSTNGLYLCQDWWNAQFLYSNDEGKTWVSRTDSSFAKDYFGFIISLDSNGAMGSLQITEFGKSTSPVPDFRKWFIEHFNILRTNRNPWMAITSSNKIFIPNSIVLTSVDTGRYWKMNDILNNRSEAHFYWTESLIVHYERQRTSSVLIDKFGQLLISSKVGVYSSNNDGKYWTRQNSGLKDSSIRMMRMNAEGIIYAITDSGKIYKGSIVPNAVRKSDDGNTVSSFTVRQNYPNPFNPSTTIEFNLPVKVSVSIKIYSVIGTEIATLADGQFTAGSHSILWNAQGMPSGLYLYQVRTSAHTDTRKMLLLK